MPVIETRELQLDTLKHPQTTSLHAFKVALILQPSFYRILDGKPSAGPLCAVKFVCYHFHAPFPKETRMLQKIQRATTRPSFIRFLFVLILVLLLLAGISRTVFAQDEPSIPGFDGTIIDENSGSFILMGPDRFWHEMEAGYQRHFWWTKNNDSGVQNSGRWTLGIEKAGAYEVAVYIPNEHATTHQAHYYVHHQGQITKIIVDQALNQNTWDPLGTFEFAGDGQEYIELTDETGEPDSDFEIAFDAVGYRKADPGLEDVIADALWDRVKIWLDEKAAEFKPHLDEWLERQKTQLLQQLGNALTSWIDEQCTGLGAAMVLPGTALILWRKRRRGN